MDKYTYSKTLVVRNPVYSISQCLRHDIPTAITGLMNDTYFRNAILIASYDFYKQLVSYNKGEVHNDKKKLGIEKTFLKYLTRMSTRSTPFGLFSTLSPITIDDQNFHDSANSQVISVQIRLDMAILESIAKLITTNYGNAILYSVNSSLAEQNGGYAFIKYNVLKNKRIYESLTLEKDDYLNILFDLKKKQFTISYLIAAFIDLKNEYSQEEIEIFILELISSRLLISSIDIHIGDETYQEKVRMTLESVLQMQLNTDPKLVAILGVINQVTNLSSTDDLAIARENIVQVLDAEGIEYSSNNIFSVNAYRAKAKVNQLSESVIKDVLKGFNIMCHYTLKKENESLDKFKEFFIDIYGDSMIDLNKVIDSVDGLGYPVNIAKIDNTNSLLQELTLVKNNSTPWSNHKYHNQNHRFWFKKYINCLKNNSTEILLQDDDLIGFANNIDQMPNTFSCSFTLINLDTENSIEDKNYLIKYNGSGGSSAINYLARFSFDNQSISNLCKEIVNLEQSLKDENEIIAEICHIPDSRIGDILTHERFWDYEIPYLVNSSLPEDKQIQIDDIMVGVRKDKVILYSKTLKKTIRPILSNAHNFRSSEHPVYRFLCDLQNSRHINGPYINLGWWINEVDFFPQIRYKNLIFIPRSWTLNKDVFKRFFLENISQQEVKVAFLEIVPKIPNVFVVGEGDNELYVDIDVESHWRLFLDYFSKQSNHKVIIKEYIGSSKMEYSNEIILSLLRKDHD